MERVAGIEPASLPWKGRVISHYTIPARAFTAADLCLHFWCVFLPAAGQANTLLYVFNYTLPIFQPLTPPIPYSLISDFWILNSEFQQFYSISTVSPAARLFLISSSRLIISSISLIFLKFALVEGCLAINEQQSLYF